MAVCGKDAVKAGVKAGDIIKQVSAIAGGSGGGSGGAMSIGFITKGDTLVDTGWYGGGGGGGWPNGSGGSGSGSGSGGSTRPTAPQTGDTFQPLVWCGALTLSAAGMAVCRQLRRKDA